MCPFRNLKKIAEKYIQRMSIWDVGILKFCLASFGILIGTSISSPQVKKTVKIFCSIVFALSWFYFVSTFIIHFVTEMSSLTTSYNKDF